MEADCGIPANLIHLLSLDQLACICSLDFLHLFLIFYPLLYLMEAMQLTLHQQYDFLNFQVLWNQYRFLVYRLLHRKLEKESAEGKLEF